jgi:hypothetical protein
MRPVYYSQGDLVADFEVVISRIIGNIGDFGVPDIGIERFLKVSDAVVNVIGVPLSRHFYSAVGQVSDHTCNAASPCNAVCGETKTYTLDPAFERDVFSDITHFNLTVKKPSLNTQ